MIYNADMKMPLRNPELEPVIISGFKLGILPEVKSDDLLNALSIEESIKQIDKEAEKVQNRLTWLNTLKDLYLNIDKI